MWENRISRKMIRSNWSVFYRMAHYQVQIRPGYVNLRMWINHKRQVRQLPGTHTEEQKNHFLLTQITNTSLCPAPRGCGRRLERSFSLCQQHDNEHNNPHFSVLFITTVQCIRYHHTTPRADSLSWKMGRWGRGWGCLINDPNQMMLMYVNVSGHTV